MISIEYSVSSHAEKLDLFRENVRRFIEQPRDHHSQVVLQAPFRGVAAPERTLGGAFPGVVPSLVWKYHLPPASKNRSERYLV